MMLSNTLSGIYELPVVLGFDCVKCVNYHKCFVVCPVKYCNDGSGDYVKINSNMCIC